MKWLTPFILFTILFAVGFGITHSLGFDTWSPVGKALSTLAVLGTSLIALLASAFLLSVDDASQDEQRQALIHNALHACNKSAEHQARNLGAWALVLDRMQGQKPVLRWRWAALWVRDSAEPFALPLSARTPLGSYAIGVNSDGSAFAKSIDSEYIEALHSAHMARSGQTHAFRKGSNPDAPNGPKPTPPANPPRASEPGADEVQWVGISEIPAETLNRMDTLCDEIQATRAKRSNPVGRD